MKQSMAKLSIRVDLHSSNRLGPGKIALLQKIDELGSITSAGKAMKKSHRRAWDLVADLKTAFRKQNVETQPGGKQSGGSHLTPFGLEMISHYRAIEVKADKAVAAHLKALEDAAKR